MPRMNTGGYQCNPCYFGKHMGDAHKKWQQERPDRPCECPSCELGCKHEDAKPGKFCPDCGALV